MCFNVKKLTMIGTCILIVSADVSIAEQIQWYKYIAIKYKITTQLIISKYKHYIT